MRIQMNFSLFLLCLSFSLPTFAATEKYRLTWRDNPATTMVVAWAQTSGNNPLVYYDTVDHGSNTAAYALQHGVDRSVSHKNMNHHFARLTGLQPNTAYYFVIADSNSTSQRFWFKTAAADDTPFTAIAGGDSRNNRNVRIQANKMVAKLRPTVVFFGGDMTDTNSSTQWQRWLDDWQYTIAADGRMFPIVAARGNHERSNSDISNIFDVPHSRVYYALTFGDNLLRTYTLNSEDTEGGDQATWLQNDLASHQDVTWRMAQYHKPMRPHVGSKSEGGSEYSAWAQHFYDYQVQLVVECDSHCVKSTWPVRPSFASGHDEGFVQDSQGTVYVGEGTWGAPLRTANDQKAWTRNSGSFNQFKWLSVSREEILVKTVRYENADNVASVNDAAPYAEPAGIDIWNPSNGAVIRLQNQDLDYPSVAIATPSDLAFFQLGETVQIEAIANVANSDITSVSFYVDDAYLTSDNSSPYATSWTPETEGSFTITVEAEAANGLSDSAQVVVNVGVQSISQRIQHSADDAEERSSGSMYLDSSDLELIRDNGNNQQVGMRFTNLNIPQGSEILSATIQFTVDETDDETTELEIYAEASDNAARFTSSSNNISNRQRTSLYSLWQPQAWPNSGQAGIDQRTPELADVLQEVIDRQGWQSGNAVAFIVTGTGQRIAESYDGTASAAPLLEVTFAANDNPPPPPPADDLLQKGVAKTNLSAATNSELHFRVEVPNGAYNLQIQTSNGSGDVDLYVRYGAKPTTSTWDQRPYKWGNAETVDIAAPNAGTYFVMLHAYESFAGLSLIADYTTSGSDTTVFSNTTPVAIPDNNSSGVSSEIVVDLNPSAGDLQIALDLTHTYIGDLIVELIAPNGERWTLHNRAGGSANDINTIYTVDAGTVQANGTWQLFVRDLAAQDTGTIQSWSLSF